MKFTIAIIAMLSAQSLAQSGSSAGAPTTVTVTINSIFQFCDDAQCRNPSPTPPLSTLSGSNTAYFLVTIIDPAYINQYITHTTFTYFSNVSVMNAFSGTPYVLATKPGYIIFCYSIAPPSVSPSVVFNVQGTLSSTPNRILQDPGASSSQASTMASTDASTSASNSTSNSSSSGSNTVTVYVINASSSSVVYTA